MPRVPFYNGIIHPSYSSLLLLCCGVTFASYFGAYMRMPIVPLFAKFLGADAFQVGMINSSFLLMAGLLSLPFGILSDWIGRKLFILAGLLISSSTSFFLCFSSTPLQLVYIYLFFGVGLAAFAPTMMSFVTDVSPASHLGRSYGWYTMALYGGMSVGPAVAGFIAQSFGFLKVFVISGALVHLVFWVVYLFLPRARHVAVHKEQTRITQDAIRLVLHNWSLFACWLVTLGGCFGLGMFITFAPLHAHERGIGMGQVGVIFGIQALCNALSRIPFGYLSDKVKNRANLVIVGLIALALSIASFGVSESFVSFVITSGAFGISMGIAFTALGVLISDVSSPESRGLAMGGFNACIYLGMMLSSLTMGVGIRETGFPKAFLVTAGIVLASALLFSLATARFRMNNRS